MMKSLPGIVTLLVLVAAASPPAPIVWTGAADANWTNGANWVGGVAPGASDVATFNAGAAACTINASVTVQGIDINGYTGAITQNAGTTATLGSSGYVQASGIFVGLLGSRMVVVGPFTSTAGFFAHGGTVVLANSAAQPLTVSVGTEFNDLAINDGLIGYWKFDETAGPVSLDSSGYGHAGAWLVSPTASADAPTVNFTDAQSVHFDGATFDGVTPNDQIVVPRTPVLEPPVGPGGGAITVACWMKRDGAATQATRWAALFRKSHNFNTNPYHGSYALQLPATGVGNGGGYSTVMWGTGHSVGVPEIDDLQSTFGSIPDQAWVHVAGVYDPSGPAPQKRLYINGVLNASSVRTDPLIYDTASPSGDLYIGQAGTAAPGLEYYNGWLDEFRVYSRALTDQEIQALSIGNQPGIGSTAAPNRTLGGGTLKVNGSLLLNAGSLSAPAQEINVYTHWLNHGGVFVPGTADVVASGGFSTSLVQSGGQAFRRFSVSSNGTWTLNDRLWVGGTLSMVNGTLDVSPRNYVIHAGTVTQYGGSTFLPRSGTVVLDSVFNSPVTFLGAPNNLRLEDPSEANLVSYLKFDEGQRPTAFDRSGSGNNGALSNDLLPSGDPAPPTRRVPGWSNLVAPTSFDNAQSIDLDGVNDFIEVGTAGLPALNAEQTISLWFRYTAVPAQVRDLVSLWNQPAPNAATVIGFRDTGSGMQLQMWTWNSGSPVLAAAPPSVNAWHHVAYTLAGTTHRLYVDGVEVATNTFAPDTGLPTRLTLGCWPDGGAGAGPIEFFQGNLDDFRLYNRTLTASEVANLAAGRYADGRLGTATFSSSGALTVNGTFTIDSGVYDANSQTTTLPNLFTLAPGNGTYLGSSATQTFNGGLTVTGSTFTGGSGLVDVNGDFVLGGGTFTAPSTNMTVSGNFTVTGSPTFTHNSGTVTFDGTTTQTVTTGGVDFFNVTINDGNGAGTSVAVTNVGALNVLGTLSITDGTLQQGAADTDDVSATGAGGVVVAANGAWTNVGAGDVALGSTGVSNSGVVSFNGGTLACGEANLISVTSSAASSAWTGTGGFRFIDITVTDQATSLPLVVYDGLVITSPGFTDNNTCPLFGFTIVPATALMPSPTVRLQTTEAAGPPAQFTVVLTAPPTASVTINISSNNLNEGVITGPGASLTFMPGTWNVAQTVTVAGVNDAIDDGNVNYVVELGQATSDDSAYSGLNPADVGFTNIDDDTAGVVITPLFGLVTHESATAPPATFTVVLTSQPIATVTVSLSVSDPLEGAITSTLPLTFTTADWDTPQPVTVDGMDDPVVDGNQAYTVVTTMTPGADGLYNAINPADVRLVNVDDDGPAGITVVPTSGVFTTESGGQATFQVVLNSPPVADVSLPLASSDANEGTLVTASPLVFTAGNWDVPRTVTIQGVDDVGPVTLTSDPYTILTGDPASADGAYDALGPANVADVAVTNVDNDAAGIVVIPTSGLVTTEAGGSEVFFVLLTTAPTGTVTVGLSTSDATEGVVAPASLTFTAALAAQMAVVTGVDDTLRDGNVAYTIVTGVAAGGGAYAGINASDVSLTNVDDEAPLPALDPAWGGCGATCGAIPLSIPWLPALAVLALLAAGLRSRRYFQ